MKGPTWFYEPVPVHMGRETYFVVVTTGRLRFVAWIEGGAFVTRMGEHLHILDNVAYWMPLPELPNSVISLTPDRSRHSDTE